MPEAEFVQLELIQNMSRQDIEGRIDPGEMDEIKRLIKNRYLMFSG
jgi:hypothetical protein